MVRSAVEAAIPGLALVIARLLQVVQDDSAMAHNSPMSEASISSPPSDLPDRLSVDQKSPFFNREVIERGIGIRFNGKERFDVEEYCLSEGWISVPSTKTLDRRGQPLMIKLKGKVEAFWR